MPIILVIEKSGALRELTLSSFDKDELYKKAGFKTSTDFDKHHTYAFAMGKVQYTPLATKEEN